MRLHASAMRNQARAADASGPGGTVVRRSQTQPTNRLPIISFMRQSDTTWSTRGLVRTWTGAHVDRGAVCSHHAAQPRPDLTSPSPTPRTPVASTAWGRSHRSLAALGLCVAFRQKRAFKTPQIVRNCLSTNLVGPNFLAYQLIAFARIFSFLNSGIDLSDFRLHRFRHRALTPCHHVVLVGLVVSCSLLRILRRHAPY